MSGIPRRGRLTRALTQEERWRFLASVHKLGFFQEQNDVLLDRENSKNLAKSSMSPRVEGWKHVLAGSILVVIVVLLGLAVSGGAGRRSVRRKTTQVLRGFETPDANQTSLLGTSPATSANDDSLTYDRRVGHTVEFLSQPRAGTRPALSDAIVDPDTDLDLFRVESGHEALFACRVYRACRDADGTLVLPVSLQWSKKLVYCGVGALGPGTPRFEPTPNASALEYIDSDWISGTVARSHMPHFAPDVMPGLFALDAALAVLLGGPNHSSEVRLFAFDRAGHRKPGALLNGIRPTVLIEDKWASLSNASWVNKFVALIPPVVDGARKVVPLRDHGRHRICFRSALVSSPRTDFGVAFGPSSSFYGGSGLSREEVAAVDIGSRVVAILVINRRGEASKDGKVKLGRNIDNVDDLDAALQSGTPGAMARVVTRVRYFEELSFEQQVAEVQAADVIVGAHGAALANMVFARRGLTLVEVVPYAYYAGPFDGQARSLGLRFVRHVAAPDPERFDQCIDHYNPPADGSAGAARFLAAQRLKARFAEAARGVTQHGESVFKFQLQDPGLDLGVAFVRPCARAQRLFVNVTEVAASALAAAEALVIARAVPTSEALRSSR